MLHHADVWSLERGEILNETEKKLFFFRYLHSCIDEAIVGFIVKESMHATERGPRDFFFFFFFSQHRDVRTLLPSYHQRLFFFF